MSQRHFPQFRWKLQFGIRTLLVTLGIVSVLLAWWKKTEESIVREVQIQCELSEYSSCYAGVVSHGSSMPEAVASRLDWLFTYSLQRVKWVSIVSYLYMDEEPFKFSRLAGFSDLEVIDLTEYPLRERDFEDLRQLPHLKLIILHTSDPALVERTEKALPGIEVARYEELNPRHYDYLNSL